MADEKYTFAQARIRLEEIVVQVRKKDVSLEKSIELLEEGVRLANVCTELSDHTEWESVAAEEAGDGQAGDGQAGDTPDAAEESGPETASAESDDAEDASEAAVPEE